MGWQDAPAVEGNKSSWASAPAVEDQPSAIGKIGRQLALTGRAAVQGTADLLALPGAIYDKAVDVYDNLRSPNLSELVTGKKPSFKFNSSQSVSNALTKAGLPQAETPQERISQNVVGAMVPAAGQAKLADFVAKGSTSLLPRLIAENMAAGPGMQILSSASGAGAGATAREAGAGPGAQLLASLAGGAAPAVIQGLGSAAVRGILRGGEEGRLKTAENIGTFADAGTTPTVGQATESRASRLAETMMGKTPGSAGVMANKATQEAKDIGGKVGELADSLTLRSGAAPAGRAISEGITGDKGFIQNFKSKQEQLYGELDQHIPKDTQVGVSNTRVALEKLNADIPGAPELSKWFKNSKIQGIEGALGKDASASQSIPYEAMKKLRTLVGNEITNSTITSDVPKSKWKALYGALSQDLGTAAEQSGPDAVKAWKRANDFTSAGMKRIENVLQPVVGKTDPEDIFKAATSGMQEGATTIQGVMKSLPDKSQRSVAATVLNRMGVAQAGKQDATGEVFSPETFLTNWNKMTPDSKTALFSRYGIDYTKNLDQVAKVASNLREGNKIFANPSGTEAAMTSRLGVAGVIYGLLFGHPGTSLALGGGMVASHVAAKQLMTNPAFVSWLAQTSRVPKGSLAAQIDVLEGLASKQTDMDQASAMKKFAADLKSSKD